MHNIRVRDHWDETRRDFLANGTLALAGLGIAGATAAQLRAAEPIGDREIRVGVVGCGGRGTGAADNALSTPGKVKVVALADAFQDRLDGCLEALASRHSEKVDVPEDRRFVGFDAFQKVLATDIDLVILATPPGFRPQHFEAAINAGKHVFMEKPVAVDAPGVRKVLAAGVLAKEKGLGVGVGLQRRHDPRYIEAVSRLQSGELGEIGLMRVYWNSGGLWVRPRQPEQTEMEYQMRNWYYFNWLCGDHIVEQHIHNLDVSNWVKNAVPAEAKGMGGRQVRTGKEYGEIFDHHAVEFTYPDGSTMLSQCRHIDGCWNQVDEYAHGSLGTTKVGSGMFRGRDGKVLWRYRGEGSDPYQQEHVDLFASIRQGEPLNEAEVGATSTMTSIMGRMATYSGRALTWDECINSTISISPAEFTWTANPPTVPDESGRYPIPVPGVTKVV